MPVKKCTVLSEEPSTDVEAIQRPESAPAIVGKGDRDYICGECDTVLIRGIGVPPMNLVIQCPECKKYNRT